MHLPINPQIESSWKEALYNEFQKPYFSDLKQFLTEEKRKYAVYPKGHDIFNAFNLTPFSNVKVVILGQDPYHGRGQAHGLCFSVPKGVEMPPSLVNIFKEIESDIGLQPFNHGNLEGWAEQGVLLINATLTVRANQAGSHQKKGWENFTDSVIKKVSTLRDSVVFLLWGAYAQAKAAIIDQNKHCVLMAPHPSPLSAYRGFFGCKHFSKANNFLIAHGLNPIDWSKH